MKIMCMIVSLHKHTSVCMVIASAMQFLMLWTVHGCVLWNFRLKMLVATSCVCSRQVSLLASVSIIIIIIWRVHFWCANVIIVVTHNYMFFII